MALDKSLDTNPQFLSVDLARQLLPSTFEHALNHLLDHEVDLAHFDARFRNDTTGAPAYPPAMLLTVVLFAYSQGIVRSRAIERVCPRARDVYGTVRHDRAALHDDRPLRVHAAGRHRQSFCGGADGVRWPRPDRARDVRDRRRQVAEQRVHASEWDARRVHAAGGEVGDDRPDRAAYQGCAAVAGVARDASGGSPWPDRRAPQKPSHGQR